jgi:hypothetical protein
MLNTPEYRDEEEFGIKATNKTPFVWFTKGGELTIKGRSFPEDGGSFYDDVFDWINDYLKNPSSSTVLTIELEYLNDITSKYLLRIIKQLDKVCYHLIVNWIYDKDDEDMFDLGQILSSSSKSCFNFVSKKN